MRSGPEPERGDSGGAVTLRVSTWGNDSRLRLTQKAVDAFTAANPDIKVTVENSEWGVLLGQARHHDGGQQLT